MYNMCLYGIFHYHQGLGTIIMSLLAAMSEHQFLLINFTYLQAQRIAKPLATF
jgi:hypothetical protein